MEPETFVKDDYPENWPEIAERIKRRFAYTCERCRHPHDPANGYTLTVHHLVPIKSLVEDWNLAALCQRCHLSVQGRVNMFQELLPGTEVSAWFVPHLQGYRAWQVVQASRVVVAIYADRWNADEMVTLQVQLERHDQEIAIAS